MSYSPKHYFSLVGQWLSLDTRRMDGQVIVSGRHEKFYQLVQIIILAIFLYIAYA